MKSRQWLILNDGIFILFLSNTNYVLNQINVWYGNQFIHCQSERLRIFIITYYYCE